MKKSILTLATALLLGTVGASFAQTSTATSYGKTKTASVNHQVNVNIPWVVMLRLTASGGSLVSFSPTLNQLQTATSTTPISVSTDANTTFDKLEGFTNSASAVTVNVAITSPGNPGTDTTVMNEVYLNGSSIADTANPVTLTIPGASSGGTAPGWTTLLDIAKKPFSFNLTGTEAPGNYTYTVTYSASVP